MRLLSSAYSMWEGLRRRFEGLPESVATVEAFLSVMEPLHKPFHEQWYLNIANLAGQQYLARDPASGMLRVNPAPSWRVRLVVNKLKTYARVQLSKIVPQSPIFYAVPSTRDNADVAGARLATKIVENIYYSEDFTEILEEIAMWVISCGIDDVFVAYDPEAGRQFYVEQRDPAGVPMVNPLTGKPVVKMMTTGDLVFDVSSPFEIIRDMSTTRMQEGQAVCRKKIRSIQYIKERYGKDVPAENISAESDYAVKVMNLVGQDVNVHVDNKLQNVAIVKDYYEKPSRRFPLGQHIITAGKEELFVGPLPSRLHGRAEWPIVTFTGIKIPGRLMPMDLISSLLPLQWKYNRGRSQLIEDTNRAARPKIFAARGEIPKGSITDEPGEVVEYNPGLSGAGPYPMKMAELPGYFLDNLKMLTAEMEDDAGVHDISMGRLPRRATSGFALSILEEKDTSILGPIRLKFSAALERIFSLALGLARDNFTESRILKIVGKAGELEERISWVGTDLGSVDDIRIIQDTDLPHSRVARLEFATGLADKGIITKQAALRIMNLHNISALEEEAQYGNDQRYAEWENFEMLKGKQLLPSEFEDKPTHIEVHKKMLAGDLPPMIRKNVELHLKQTEAFARMEAQGTNDGGPPMPPPPPTLMPPALGGAFAGGGQGLTNLE